MADRDDRFDGSGPVAERLDRFMARANSRYYAERDPFADFTTAPEIAQVFGELLGAWVSVSWELMGAPDPVILAEAGPGRGTLMADALRLIRRLRPALHRAARLHLVETSPRLREAQAAALLPDRPCWHERVAALPDGPLLLLANEFLDALPIRQFERRNEEWLERHVQDGRFVLLPADRAPPLPAGYPVAEHDVATMCEDAEQVVAILAGRVARHGGAALLLDYGFDRAGVGDTLQALRDGRPAPPLERAGEADLTAHVDFPRLAAVAREHGAAVHGPVGQGWFLSALGLFPRTEQLMRGRSPEQARVLADAAHRLAAPERMGRLFKAMVLCHPGSPVPPGFDDEDPG